MTERTYIYPENRSRFILPRANALGNNWGERERAPTWWSQRDFCTIYIYNIIYIYYTFVRSSYVRRTSSCTVTRATRKREAGLITSVEIASATKLQTLRCCARETGDRTHVPVRRRLSASTEPPEQPESQREASLRTIDFSKPN